MEDIPVGVIIEAVKHYWFLVVAILAGLRYTAKWALGQMNARFDHIEGVQRTRHDEVTTRIAGVEMRLKEMNGNVARNTRDIAVLDERTHR